MHEVKTKCQKLREYIAISNWYAANLCLERHLGDIGGAVA